jgi:hypothetical protein
MGRLGGNHPTRYGDRDACHVPDQADGLAAQRARHDLAGPLASDERASMLLPTFVVMGPLTVGVATTGTLMVPEHGGMLGCMLVAILLRRQEYSGVGHAHGSAEPTIAA